MSYIHCCGGLRKARSFSLLPQKEFKYSQLDYLEFCPVCGHTVIQVTRIDENYKITSFRKINEKARIFLKKIKPLILIEKNPIKNTHFQGSKFYLYYNEFGIRKKCFSNLKNLKIGLQDNLA